MSQFFESGGQSILEILFTSRTMDVLIAVFDDKKVKK